jgi:hypothetical protein
VIDIAHLATGTPNGSKFVRDDGVLATPAGGGDVSGPGASVVDWHAVVWDGTSGTAIKDGGGSIVKSADETVTSSTTLQNDDELVFALAASAVYKIDGAISVAGATAGDIKTAFTVPTSATGNVEFIGATVAASGSDNWSRALNIVDFVTPDFGTFGTLGVATFQPVLIKGAIFTAGSSGNLTFQWAQNASSGTATTVGKGSWITVTRIQ